MSSKGKLPSVLFIVGPTGVGKTKIGALVCAKINGEIISADSRQMFRGMNIGTDKPPAEILKNIKHHFIDCLDPDDYYNAGQFGKDGRIVIAGIISRNKVPIVVGGSGLYIKSLLEGFFDEKVKNLGIKKELRSRCDEEGSERLYNELMKIDPDFAGSISINDAQRIIRGLEVYYATGKPLTYHWKQSKTSLNFQPVLIGLRKERKELYDVINRRVDKMIEKGLVDEVKQLKAKGYSPEINSFNTFGYKETFTYLKGTIDHEEMVNQIKKSTRNFAKRQIAWFGKMRGIRWIDVGNDIEDIAQSIVAIMINSR